MQRVHDSQGVALLEMLWVIAITTMVAVWGANRWFHEAQDKLAQATAAWLWTVKLAMEEAILHERENMRVQNGQIDLNAVHIPQSLKDLQQKGYLAPHFPLAPPLPYQFAIQVLRETTGCGPDQCPLNVVLLLKPTPALGPTDSLWSYTTAIAAGLQGQGLAVTEAAPNRLQGAQRHWPNPLPLTGQSAFAVGTVATVSRVIMRPPPYVRLNETRPVVLAGQVAIKEGLVIQASHTTGQPCMVNGQVVRRVKGGLLVCEKGYWRAVGDGLFNALKPLTYHACGSPSRLDPYLEYVMTIFPIEFRSPAPPPPGDCVCPSGYRQVLAHSARIDPHGVPIKNGFVCATP